MTDLEIAAYVDHGLSADRREEIEEHLSQCASCRENVLETQQLVKRSTVASRFMRPLLMVAAAAVVAVVALPALRTLREPAVTARGGDTRAAALLAYGPLGEVQSTAIRFTWGATKDALSYHLGVKRDDGAVVWEASLTDTTVALPLNIPLEAGQRYDWVVDAISSDGVTRSTGTHEFGIVR